MPVKRKGKASSLVIPCVVQILRESQPVYHPSAHLLGGFGRGSLVLEELGCGSSLARAWSVLGARHSVLARC